MVVAMVAMGATMRWKTKWKIAFVALLALGPVLMTWQGVCLLCVWCYRAATPFSVQASLVSSGQGSLPGYYCLALTVKLAGPHWERTQTPQVRGTGHGPSHLHAPGQWGKQFTASTIISCSVTVFMTRRWMITGTGVTSSGCWPAGGSRHKADTTRT